ncbi:MAG: hypothetical protein AAGD96_33860 [Chloroflexota bacterium]
MAKRSGEAAGVLKLQREENRLWAVWGIFQSDSLAAAAKLLATTCVTKRRQLRSQLNFVEIH